MKRIEKTSCTVKSPPRDHEVRELAGDKVQVVVLKKYFGDLLLNLFSQVRAQPLLQQTYFNVCTKAGDSSRHFLIGT